MRNIQIIIIYFNDNTYLAFPAVSFQISSGQAEVQSSCLWLHYDNNFMVEM